MAISGAPVSASGSRQVSQGALDAGGEVLGVIPRSSSIGFNDDPVGFLNLGGLWTPLLTALGSLVDALAGLISRLDGSVKESAATLRPTRRVSQA